MSLDYDISQSVLILTVVYRWLVIFSEGVGFWFIVILDKVLLF